MVCICREKTGKAKAQFDLKLARLVSDNKKSVFKYVNGKRRPKESVGLILIKGCNLPNRDEEEVEAFSALSASVFNKMLMDLGLPSPLS